MLQLIDSHCHIDFADFDSDRDAVIDAAMQVGVQHIVVPAVSKESWPKCIDTYNQYNACHLALGLHPIFIDQHQPDHLSELDELVKLHQPIAVGEIGLDFYDKNLDREKQLSYFAKQLIIAKRNALPVIIHNRKAHDECLTMLRESQLEGGIIHAFNGSLQQAHKYIELGFLLGFGGMLTYSRSVKLRALAKAIPIEHIALETDAPDMTVERHRGQRNSPSFLPDVLHALSEIKQLSAEDVASSTTSNVRTLLKI